MLNRDPMQCDILLYCRYITWTFICPTVNVIDDLLAITLVTCLSRIGAL